LTAGLVLMPAVAEAGMPHLRLTEMGQRSVSAFSFFLFSVFVLAGVVRVQWNTVARELPRLPRLSYFTALAATVLWGMLFHLVLTMISGARELMTPGAWQRAGITWELTPIATEREQIVHARRLRIEQLRADLVRYAQAHDGRLPPSSFDPELPPELWATAHPSAARFAYVGGHRVDAGSAIVAFEPAVYDALRFVLRADGTIVRMPIRDIVHELRYGKPLR
jgi:hypothetical protein